MAIPMLAGFVIAPFLVHRLGELRYGEWILIASMTNYFGLLDLGIGVRSAVTSPIIAPAASRKA